MKTIIAVASIWALSSFVTITTAKRDACSSIVDSCYCKNEPLHTRCKALDQKACCSNYTSAAPTDSDIKVILDRHNEIRNKVASGEEDKCPNLQCDGSTCQSAYLPSANNMNELCWDIELAQIAQKLADTCVYGHEPQYSYRADLCGRYNGVGQNIYLSATDDLTATKVNFLNTINAWYSEVCRLPEEEIFNFSGGSDPNKAFGHYTQLIWAKTTHVGCGAATYVCDGWIKHLVVCNYGPFGNLVGDSIFGATFVYPPKLDCKADATYTSLCNCEACTGINLQVGCDCTKSTSQYMGI